MLNSLSLPDHLRRIGGLALILLLASQAVEAQVSGYPGTVVHQTGDEPPPSSEEGALFLLLPVGAQGVGLARAMTAMPGVEGAFWNPAGLAHLDRSQVILTYGEHVAGEATAMSALWLRPGLGTLGISYGLLDSGTQELTDQTGTVLGSISVRGHHAILSAAREITSRFHGGLSAKFVQFRQSCRGQCPDAGVRATSYAVDLGAQIRPLATRPLNLGIMLAHVGPRLRVAATDQSDPLPARIRIAGSYVLSQEVSDELLQVRILAEVEDRLREPGEPSVYFGTEFTAGTDDQVYIRGGYMLGNLSQTDGAALGFGLRYERFEFGIARSLARGGPAIDQEPVHITLGVAF